MQGRRVSGWFWHVIVTAGEGRVVELEVELSGLGSEGWAGRM